MLSRCGMTGLLATGAFLRGRTAQAQAPVPNLATVPGVEAFRPLSAGICELV